KVYISQPGILRELYVKDGQPVIEGEELARLRDVELENQLEESRTEYFVRERQLDALQDQRNKNLSSDQQEMSDLDVSISQMRKERDYYGSQVEGYEREKERLVIRAPRSGVVMSPP